MNFAVNGNAVVCNIIDGEIRARMASRNDPEKKQRYKELRVIDSTPVITKFMVEHPKVFGNKKLIHQDGSNFFGGIVPLASLDDTQAHREMLRNRMKYEYGLTDAELPAMDRFIDDLYNLKATPEIQSIVSETEEYKESIEKMWKANESSIMRYIHGVLGYIPEKVGKVNTYVMYPTVDTHRSYQISGSKTCLYFGKKEEEDPNKILAYLTHQAVHQPMLPYKSSMTKKEKEEFHAFIKFLTDKDVYNQLTGRSYLEITTQAENAEVMGRVYPFWLGYRYRNADKQGLNPEEEVSKAIKRDKEYFDRLPEKSRKRSLYSTYNFDRLDPKKIARLFRERRGITPYEFVKLDFEDRSLVEITTQAKSKKASSENEERVI